MKKVCLAFLLLSVALTGCRRVTNPVSISDPYGARSYRHYENAVVYDTVPKGTDRLSDKPSEMVLKDDRVQWHLHEHTSARHRWVAEPPQGTRLFLHVKGRFVAKGGGGVAGKGEGESEPPEWRSLAIDIDIDADSNRNGKIDEDPGGEDNLAAEDAAEETKPGAVLCKESELIVRKIKVDLTKAPVVSATGKVIVKRSDAKKFDIRRRADDPTTSIFKGNKKDSLDFFDEVKDHDVRLWMVPLAKEGDGEVTVNMDAKIQLKGRTEIVKFKDKVRVHSMGLAISINVFPPFSTIDGNNSDEFSVIIQPSGLSIESYTWTWEAPEGAGNDPHVTFTTPHAKTTTVNNAHWFALPDNRLASIAGPESWYTVNCKVVINGIELKDFTPPTWRVYVPIPAASTIVPRIEGLVTIDVRKIGDSYEWFVSDMGSLHRTAPLVKPYIPNTSQFL